MLTGVALGLSMLGGAGAASAQPATNTPAASLTGPAIGAGSVSVVQTSDDPYGDAGYNHHTEVETMGAGFGSTIVQVAQVARNIGGGGAENIGWATSTDGGSTWTYGFLPNISRAGGGPSVRASDPVVAYDAKHGTWLIVTLALGPTGIVVSLSPDGLTWSDPVPVLQPASGVSADKEWITCDNFPDSPFYGNCYAMWDQPNSLFFMSTSTDGGQSWSPLVNTDGLDRGIGAVPVVTPAGTVIVPHASGGSIKVFTSVNGGDSWTAAVPVARASRHRIAGGLRAGGTLPSATVDAAGNVYIAWDDCQFETGCAANDAVFVVSSDDGATWSDPVRIPIDAVDSGADYFEPAIAADPSPTGDRLPLGVTFYSYPDAGCTASTCQLTAGFISSTDGGATWSAPMRLGDPMPLNWLASTGGNRFAGDYFGTAVSNGAFVPMFIAATAPDADGTLHEFMAAAGPIVP